MTALATQIGVAGTTAHTPLPRATTYGHAREVPSGAQTCDLPAIAGTARGIARPPARGVAAVAVPSAPAGRPASTVRRSPGRTATAAASRLRHHQPVLGPVALVLVLVGIFATGFGFEQVTGTALPGWLPGGHRPAREFPAMAASDPISITIPALRLQAPVHDVGMADNGTIAVPELDRHNEAGWYVASPTPGETGPAVIVGHVDTRTGPSVFYQAGTLHPGAEIEIGRQDRSVAVFEVTSVERFDKSALPADRVYADFSRPGLRLITCGGRWVGGETGYAENVVVFAALVSARRR